MGMDVLGLHYGEGACRGRHTSNLSQASIVSKRRILHMGQSTTKQSHLLFVWKSAGTNAQVLRGSRVASAMEPTKGCFRLLCSVEDLTFSGQWTTGLANWNSECFGESRLWESSRAGYAKISRNQGRTHDQPGATYDPLVPRSQSPWEDKQASL